MPPIREVLRRDAGGGSMVDVPIAFEHCRVTIEKEVHFIRGGDFAQGNRDSDFAAMIGQIRQAAMKLLDYKFQLRMTKTAPWENDCPCDVIPIEVRFKVVGPGQGYGITLVGGQQGRSNDSTIYEKGNLAGNSDRPDTFAHECGHALLGLPDEYAGNPANSPVFRDNSIMGNYYEEGIDKAAAKERHFEFARDWLQGKLPIESGGCRVTLERRVV